MQREGRGLVGGFSNPQPNPQKMMPCTTCAYFGSPRESVSHCKTYSRSAVTPAFGQNASERQLTVGRSLHTFFGVLRTQLCARSVLKSDRVSLRRGKLGVSGPVQWVAIVVFSDTPGLLRRVLCWLTSLVKRA